MIDKPDHNDTDSNDKLPELPPAAAKARGAGFALFIASLALFFTAAGVATGYRHWQRMNDKAKDNATQIAQLQTTLSSKVDATALETLRQQLEDRVSEIQTSSGDSLQKMLQIKSQSEQYAESVTAQVEQVTRLQARLQQSAAPASAKEWRLEEVAFLLRLATQELILTGNKSSAMTALKEADQILSTYASITYLPVRQQITHDLAALEAFSPPDMVEISQQITSIMLSLSPKAMNMTQNTPNTESAQETTSPPDKEPIADPTPESKEEPKAESKSEADSGIESGTNPANDNTQHDSIWQQYKQKALDALNEAVIVHQLDRPMASTLNSEALKSLYKLMQLRLENLRLMALQRQDKNFHQQIDLIRDNFNTYYPEPQVKPLLEKLATLSAIQLEPAVPDISGSLMQLEKARQADLAGEQKP